MRITLPYHNYVGPGNVLDNGEHVDEDDLIAREHDNAYEAAQHPQQVQEADDHAISDFIGSFAGGNLHSAVGALGLTAKRAIERVVGVQYGMSHRYNPYLGSRPQNLESYEDSSPFSSQGSATHSQVQADVHRSQGGTSQGTDPNRPKILQNIALGSRGIIRQDPDTIESAGADSSKKQRVGEYFSNFQASGTSGMDTPTQSNEAMEVGAASVNQRAGSGPGMGNLGMGGLMAPPTISCQPGEGSPCKLTYRKSYRFVVPTCLTTMSKGNYYNIGPNGNGASYYVRWKIGSSATIPMQYLFLYMDPSEFADIGNRFSQFEVHTVSIRVDSQGARAPYTTNTSNIEVANANLQANVMDITPIHKHFGTHIDLNQLADLSQKCVGSTVAPSNQTAMPVVAPSSIFNNISARMETRILRNRTYIDVPIMMMGVPTAPNAPQKNLGPAIGHPSLLHFVRHSINASNHLGPAFADHHTINNVLFRRTGTANSNNALNDTADVYLTNRGDNTGVGIAREFTPVDANDLDGSSAVIDSQNVFQDNPYLPQYSQADVWGTLSHHDSSKVKQLYFSMAIYNIRNFENNVIEDTSSTAYNSIVNLNFECILNFELTATAHIVIPIYYQPSEWPKSYYKEQSVRRQWNNTNPNVSLIRNSSQNRYGDYSVPIEAMPAVGENLLGYFGQN